jgi:hypothetical protein
MPYIFEGSRNRMLKAIPPLAFVATNYTERPIVPWS